jgi:dTDP-4-amino-4,6-dideoxygalactose transaminase
MDIIESKITNCMMTNHFTNNGVNVIDLQKKIKNIFGIGDDKEVLVVCNGAMGINALIGGLCIHYDKKLKFAVQTFTFPCSNQGILMDSVICDMDSNHCISLSELEKYKDIYDGIIITNCFGCTIDIDKYIEFANTNDKLLLFDNAASSYTIYGKKNHLNYGIGCMVSLHHTKPIGFGEGGFIIFDNNYLESMKKAICFGYTDNNKYDYSIYSSNYKMSEIAAIYIYQFLDNFSEIYNHHTKTMRYFINNIDNNKIDIFKNYSEYDESLLSCIPIIPKNKLTVEIFIQNNIEAKKYYYPLDKSCKNGVELFNKIICLPLNINVNFEHIDRYIKIINASE